MQFARKQVPLVKVFVKTTDLLKWSTEKYLKWEIGTDRNR